MRVLIAIVLGSTGYTAIMIAGRFWDMIKGGDFAGPVIMVAGGLLLYSAGIVTAAKTR